MMRILTDFLILVFVIFHKLKTEGCELKTATF